MLNSSDTLLLFELVKKMSCKEIRDFNNVLQDEFTLKYKQEKLYSPMLSNR